MCQLNVLHVANFFDPAASIVRAVDELKKHSRHRHQLVLKQTHEFQHLYQYPEPWLIQKRVGPNGRDEKPATASNSELVYHLFDWADVVLYQFAGYEDGWHDLRKPSGFRNINIYYDAVSDRFFCLRGYSARDLKPYKLLASSHVGASDFLGQERFRWLPDLIPIHDALYIPDYSQRGYPTVSFIKHSPVLCDVDFAADGSHVIKQNLDGQALATILWKRKTQATVVLDNICDGHFGLAGMEAMALGLPCVVFNHAHTCAALRELAPDQYPPFIEVGPSLHEAIAGINRVLRMPKQEYVALRHEIRAWTEKHFDPRYLIERYWDRFFEELAA